MSKGPGRIQRAITAVFEADPARRATVAELAAEIIGTTEKSALDTVDRALRRIAPALGLIACRAATPKSHGWRNVWGKA